MPRKNSKNNQKKSVSSPVKQPYIYPENPTINHIERYILKLSDERRKILLKLTEKFFSRISLYYNTKNKNLINSIENFNIIREQLPYVLEMFRDPREWFINDKDNGTMNIVDRVLRYINNYLINDLSLSMIEMEHLYCIGRISAIAQCFDLCYEVIDKIQETCSRAIGIEYLVDIAFKRGPGRGHVCHKLKNILMGEYLSPYSKRSLLQYAWVTPAHVASVCTAIATVLTDRQSSSETNGWCFSAAICLLESGKWTDVAAPLLIDSARVAFLRGQVQT
jgi:hypothetical protein